MAASLCEILLRLTFLGLQGEPGDALPADLPTLRYHLTARPWKPLGIPASAYLDRIEGECRFWAKHLDDSGAILDPYIQKEWQYATPYFAYAVATLVHAGRARDLLAKGVLAMDHACERFAAGRADGHNEFFVPPLVEAILLYSESVPAAKAQTWRTELGTTFKPGGTNNWRTYFMKGQWLRARAGVIEKSLAVNGIEGDWLMSQSQRIEPSRWNLYHDTSSDPDSLAVEVVGRGNLLALGYHGYDGPSAAAIHSSALRGTAASLLTQDPAGQAPANGRTDDHVWVDVGYQLAFEVLAELAWSKNDRRLAGQYRHAAELAFGNIERWRRADPAWVGSFFVTKNKFDPSLRVGYQTASQYSNYNGSIMYHTAEAYHVRKSEIPEQAAPVEIGGYAFATDGGFAAAFANAGGMAMEIDLRGATRQVFGHYWTALGVVRLGRPAWDTRLGPSDGVRDASSGLGVAFAPTWEEGGAWVRLPSLPDRYQGSFKAILAHPLLTRCSVTWTPKPGKSGPSFLQEFTLTPDGLLSEVSQQDGTAAWGMTCPLLLSDGESTLVQSVSQKDRIASVKFADGGDAQNFIVLSSKGLSMDAEAPLRTSFGDVSPVRVTTSDACHRTWVYPSGPEDPRATEVRDTFVLTPGGFQSVLGRVQGSLYVGRTAAGGVGDKIDLAGKGVPDATFSAPCGFILQLDHGTVTAVEADRAVTATVQGHAVSLSPYVPLGIAGK